MTGTTLAPERLRHYEYETDPFTEDELSAIAAYEDVAGPLGDCLISADEGMPVPGTDYDEYNRANILTCFQWLSEWYEALDSLKSGLRNPHGSPAHSSAGYRYLQDKCNRWYHTLNFVRREACRWALGTAGPEPEVDSGYLTFFDIPGVVLNGTIAAESQ